MAEDQNNNAEQIPPKLDLTKDNGLDQSILDNSDTMQIKVPPGDEAPTLKIRPSTETKGAKKKETSRIPLEAATTDPSEGKGKPAGPPKTIRIKPITKKKPITLPKIAAETEPAKLDDKRKTSRISLDAVFSEAGTPAQDEEAGAADQPKTIRLKRPTEASTVKIARRPTPPVAPSPAELPASEAKTVLGKTSRIDSLPEMEDEITPTRRKTIRVKRPTSSQPVKSLSIKRTDEDLETQASPFEMEMPVVQPDRPNFLFPLFAAAALIIACVTIYVMCAQAFGANSSLTQMSWWPTGPNLNWPNKIIPTK